MPTTTSMVAVELIAGLKSMPVSAMPTIALVVGATSTSDGLGGFYRWTAGDTSTEDTRFYNVVASTVAGANGRWIRIFQRLRTMSGGYLVSNGGFKEFFFPGTLDANGRITVYLTMDGTATGAAMFTEVWTTQGDGAAAGTGANDSIIGSKRSLSSDLKTLVYQFVRGSSVTVSLLGLVVPGLTQAPSGTAVVVRVSGI